MKWHGCCAWFLACIGIGAIGDAKGELPSLVTASSRVEAPFAAAMALDGKRDTRWASQTGAEGEWIQVDLGEVKPVGDFTIAWEKACARDYEVLVSADGASWTCVLHETAGNEGDAVIHGNGAPGRFVKILCHVSAGFNDYSIWEIAFQDEGCARALEEHAKRIEAARLDEEQKARDALRTALDAAGVTEIVYAARPLAEDGHWYANIGYYAESDQHKAYAKGGGLYVFTVADNASRPLLEDAEGTVRDPAVHYDGRTIVFSWRKGGENTFHLYTIAADGTDLRQVTSGPYDDFEPAWLPDDGIVFVSTRCRRWVNCWLTQVANLHRCDRDGGNLHPISANIEHDNTPWPMPDGRILYTRWEYVDRSQVDYHHLWAMNPDGAGQMTYFGNMNPPDLYIDAKPVPGTDEVLFIDSPGHGAREHAGFVALLNPLLGPDNKSSLRHIGEIGCRDPYPIAQNLFLAARGPFMMLLNREGVTEKLERIAVKDMELHEPRPLVAHPREHVVPHRDDKEKTTGRLILTDVRTGRNMGGVAPGEIAKLLVVESLPKPINYTGGMDPLSYGGTFTLERILGTVPVEDDGSAYLELPASKSLFFVALDANDNAIKRMQSFLTVMPGETTSCVGCHEPRTRASNNPGRPRLKAIERDPSAITPIPGIPDVFDFPRDIQPILDNHCLACHDYQPHDGAEFGPRASGVILSGDHGPIYSHSYVSLTVYHQIADGRNRAVSNYPPRTLGAPASPLFQKMLGGHHGVALSSDELKTVRFWIETGAPYPGTYGALGAGGIGIYNANKLVQVDDEWPETLDAKAAIERRCSGCHKDALQLPKTLSDENTLSFWRPEWGDRKLLRCRHLMFNLSRPELSAMLLAPLDTAAGGYGLCGEPVFANTDDPDYRAIVGMCTAGKTRLEQIKRFDMPGYQPPAPYIREMKRYGILPPDLPAEAPVDVYQCDKAYWDSFDWTVAMANPAYARP